MTQPPQNQGTPAPAAAPIPPQPYQPPYQPPAAYPAQPTYGNNPYQNPYQVPYQQERSSTALSVVAMVLGIISLLGFIFNIFAAALGLIAIILGGISVAIEPRGRGFAITGIIAGALAIIVGIGLFVWVLNNEDFLKELEQQSKHSAAPLDSLVVSVNK